MREILYEYESRGIYTMIRDQTKPKIISSGTNIIEAKKILYLVMFALIRAVSNSLWPEVNETRL